MLQMSLGCTVTLVRQTNLRSRGTDKHRQPDTDMQPGSLVHTHSEREKVVYGHGLVLVGLAMARRRLELGKLGPRLAE